MIVFNVSPWKTTRKGQKTVVGFIISNSQTNLKPVGFIRGGFINIRTVPKEQVLNGFVSGQII